MGRACILVFALLAISGLRLGVAINQNAKLEDNEEAQACGVRSSLEPMVGIYENKLKDPVALTARWIAAARATETARADAVFQDPYARALAGSEGFNYRGGSAPIATSRTLFMDKFMEEGVDAGIPQVVLLAAGMDTRAFRLRVPVDTCVFELDKQDLFRVKEPILDAMGARALCDRRVVPVDLETPQWEDALFESGFDSTKRTVWILEGLIYYIPEMAVRTVLDKVSALSAPGSRVVADMVNQDFMDSASTESHRRDMAQRGAPWLFGHNDPKTLFAQSHLDAKAIDLNYLHVDRHSRRIVIDWDRAEFDHAQRHSNLFEPMTFYVTAVKA